MKTASINCPPLLLEMREQGAASRSFCGRIFSPNWEKVILFCNSALTVIAVVYVFFSLKLPLIAIGLGLYGVATLMLRGKVTLPTKEKVAQLEGELKSQREHNNLLSEKINRNLSGSEIKKEIEEDILTAEAKLRAVRKSLVEYEGKRNAVRAERDTLLNERDLLRKQIKNGKQA